MPEILDWQNAPDPHAVVRRAVAVLGQGGLVAFPTETAYAVAASALDVAAVGRLPGRRLSLAVCGPGDALDWVPDMSRLGRRLARRCWPGPVTLSFPCGAEHGVASRVPEAVRQRLCHDGGICLRAPAHEAVLNVLTQAHGPVVLAGAAPPAKPPATHAAEVVQSLGEAVDVVIDDGPGQYGGSTTVVRIEGENWRVQRAGVVDEEMLRRQTACLVVFVCTGNTCRSPLAEALCKKQLADRLGCGVNELPGRGFLVLSAGVAAMMGGAAAEEAVAVAGEYGADLSQHRSQMVSAAMAAQADHVVVMTDSHRRAVLQAFGHLSPRVRLLSPTGDDLADPVGADREVYRDCARQIAEHLRGLVVELTEG